MKTFQTSPNFFPKRLLFARKPAGPLITGEGDEAGSFSEVSGLEEIDTLTGSDDLKALLKKQDEIAMMSDEDFRIEFGFDGPDEDIANEKIKEHQKLTKEFYARITAAEKKGLDALQGLTPAEISTITNELDSELAEPTVQAALGDARVAESLKRLNTGAGMTPNTAENLSLAYLEHKARKEELERLKNAQIALQQRINSSKITREQLEVDYQKDLEEFCDRHPFLGALGGGRVVLFFTRWDRFNRWFTGKDFDLTEEVGGVSMTMDQLKAGLKTAEDTFNVANDRLTNLKRDFTSRKAMATTVFQSLDEKMKNLKTSLVALNRRIGTSTNADLLAQRDQIVAKIAALKKSHVLAKTIAKSMNMLDEKAQKAPVDIAELSAMSADIDADGIKAAYAKVAQRNEARTKKAREEIGPMEISGIKSDLENLTLWETGNVYGFINRLGNPTRPPSEDSALLKVRAMISIRDHMPRLYNLLEKLTKIPPADLVHNKIFRNLRSNLDYQNRECTAMNRQLNAEFAALPANTKTQLMQKATLEALISEGHLEMPEDFFQNDFRTDAELRKYVLSNASYKEAKSFLEAVKKLKPDASGKSELVIGGDGTIEKSEQLSERLKNEAKTAYIALPANIKTAFEADFGQITSIPLKGFTPTPPLPPAALSNNMDEYVELCNPNELRTLKEFLIQLKKRGHVYGANQVVDLSEGKKLEALELFEQLSLMDPERGLRGARECILQHPAQRFNQALRILKSLGAIGRRDFSPAFMALAGPFPDEDRFLDAIANDDDRDLVVKILQIMPDRIMTTPFDMDKDRAARSILPEAEFEFYSIEYAIRDIQEDMNALLRFSGTNDLSNITDIALRSGENLKTGVLNGVEAAPAGVSINGQPLNNPANRKYLPYLLITMDHLVGNINDGIFEINPRSAPGDIKIRETIAVGGVIGSFYDIYGREYP